MELIRVAAVDHHLHAFACQRLRDRTPDSLARSADDRDFPFESKFHFQVPPRFKSLPVLLQIFTYARRGARRTIHTCAKVEAGATPHTAESADAAAVSSRRLRRRAASRATSSTANQKRPLHHSPAKMESRGRVASRRFAAEMSVRHIGRDRHCDRIAFHACRYLSRQRRG